MADGSFPDRSSFSLSLPASRFRDGRFHNLVPAEPPGWRKSIEIAWRFFFDKPKESVPPVALPVQRISSRELQIAPDGTLYRLGHSSLLLKLGGAYWLTDPVFSERASPFSWVGPKRFHASPIEVEELPPIEGVILSHDHYDHLDYQTIKRLDPKVRHYWVPLGVGRRLISWGVAPAKVQELDWWQAVEVGDLRLIATPAQHFSGRSISDRNSTLWASWVILGDGLRLFFGGDSGYHQGFRRIGESYGPFDLTMLETGAYDLMWPDIHMQPHETIQAHFDLQGRWLLPIHNGTFDLALHVWDDPFERIAELAQQKQALVTTPQMGEPLFLRNPMVGSPWWRSIAKKETVMVAAAGL